MRNHAELRVLLHGKFNRRTHRKGQSQLLLLLPGEGFRDAESQGLLWDSRLRRHDGDRPDAGRCVRTGHDFASVPNTGSSTALPLLGLERPRTRGTSSACPRRRRAGHWRAAAVPTATTTPKSTSLKRSPACWEPYARRKATAPASPTAERCESSAATRHVAASVEAAHALGNNNVFRARFVSACVHAGNVGNAIANTWYCPGRSNIGNVEEDITTLQF